MAARGLLGSVSGADWPPWLVHREAGDERSAAEARNGLLEQVEGRPLVVADAGCALELRAAGARTLAGACSIRVLHAWVGCRAWGTAFAGTTPACLARGLGIEAEIGVVAPGNLQTG